MHARTQQRKANRADAIHKVGAGVCVLATLIALPVLWHWAGLAFEHLHGVLSPAHRAVAFGLEYYVELGLAFSVVVLAGILGSLAGMWRSWQRGRYRTATIWLILLILIVLKVAGFL